MQLAGNSHSPQCSSRRPTAIRAASNSAPAEVEEPDGGPAEILMWSMILPKNLTQCGVLVFRLGVMNAIPLLLVERVWSAGEAFSSRTGSLFAKVVICLIQ